MGVLRGEGWKDKIEPKTEAGKEKLAEKEAAEEVLGESTVVVEEGDVGGDEKKEL
jgi:hypothetical protein